MSALHRDVQLGSECGGQVVDQRGNAYKLFGTDYRCVRCGKTWNTIPELVQVTRTIWVRADKVAAFNAARKG